MLMQHEVRTNDFSDCGCMAVRYLYEEGKNVNVASCCLRADDRRDRTLNENMNKETRVFIAETGRPQNSELHCGEMLPDKYKSRGSTVFL